ncbi:hypothetical protein AWC31_27735 [Mycolicibacterium wolinskyi]|uniref:Secreted protein n=1 Tax=Mycolicibacterium wolinskyi TaxID=59750 RepID=A0A1X2F938_9MYCO|nr:hypothetical protein AWC31_27735 [Mycolicibacterium wolinskyi]
MRAKRFAVALLTMASISLGLAGNAYADDDDDDDDDSASRSSSSVESWPPTAVQWPPLVPENTSNSDEPPVIPIP